MYKIQNKNGETVAIQRQSDGASIPLAPDNADYQAYLKWLDEGNEPLPADEGEA